MVDNNYLLMDTGVEPKAKSMGLVQKTLIILVSTLLVLLPYLMFAGVSFVAGLLFNEHPYLVLLPIGFIGMMLFGGKS